MLYRCIICLLCLLITGNVYAEKDVSLNILYTGNIKGKILTQRKWGGKTAGGLARIAQIINSTREKNDNTLLLDYGGIFDNYNRRDLDRKIKADLRLKSLKLMGYDAVNVGKNEFSFGQNYLKSFGNDVPFISSNLNFEKNPTLPIKKYIIKNIGELKVGITGILSSKAFDNFPAREYVRNLKIVNPETALQTLIPELKRKTDLIILLSQDSYEATTSLVNKIKGIDLVIYHEDAPCGCGTKDKTDSPKPEKTSTSLVQANLNGEHVGILQIMKGANGIKLAKDEIIIVDVKVAEEPVLGKMINSEFTEEKKQQRKLEAEKKEKELHKEMMSGLKMSPEDFFKLYQTMQDASAGGVK